MRSKCRISRVFIIFLISYALVIWGNAEKVFAEENSYVEVLNYSDGGGELPRSDKSLRVAFLKGDAEVPVKDNVIYTNKDITAIVPKDDITPEEQEIIDSVKQSLIDEYPNKKISFYIDNYIGVTRYEGGEFSEYTELKDGKLSISQNSITKNERQIVLFKKIASYKFYIEEDVSDNDIRKERIEDEDIIKLVDITLYSPIYQILFDRILPEITLSGSNNSSKLMQGESIATVIVCDDTGLKEVSFYRNDKPIENVVLEGDKRIIKYEYDVALIKDSDREDSIQVRAIDLCGNEREYMFTYHVDSSAPIISCSGVIDGNIYADEVKINVIAEDNAPYVHVFYRVDYTDTSSETRCLESLTKDCNGMFEINREYRDEGIYDIIMFAYDANGNYSKTLRYSFGIDINAPVISFEGVNNDETYSDSVDVCAMVSEIFHEGTSVEWSGIVEDIYGKRTIELPPYEVKSRVNKNIVTFSNEGKYLISLRAVDTSGHEAQTSCEFIIDKSSPEVEVEVNGDNVLKAGATGISEVLKNVPDISVNTKDSYLEYSVVASVYEKEKDGSFKLNNISNYMSVGKQATFNVFIPGEGEFIIRICAKDGAGNVCEKSVSLLIDENPPVIGYLSDFNEKYLKEFRLPRNFKNYIQDETNIKYRAYLNSKEINSCDIKKDGKYLLQVVAEDEAGNRSESVTAFIVDNTKPRVIVNGIGDDGKIVKNGIIRLSLFDEDDFFREAFVNGECVGIEGNGREVIIKAEDYGDYDISVVASDYAGNEITQVVKTSCALSANPFTVKINSDDIKTLTKNEEEIHESFFDKIQGEKFGVFCGFMFAMAVFFAGIALFDIRRLRR